MQGFLASELEKTILGLSMFPCWGNSGLCWANVGQIGVYVGPMLSHLQPMWGRWWVIWWALWGSIAISGMKNISNENFSFGMFFWARKIPNEKKFSLGFFWVLVRGYIGPFWAVLGLCWAHIGSFGGLFGVPRKFLEGKNNPQHKAFCVEGYFGRLFGTMLGQCWAVLGLCWAHIGSFGGLFGVPRKFLEGKNNPQHKAFCVEGYFGRLFGTMLGQCWAVLGLCWAHVGSFGGLYGVPWGVKPSTEDF